MKTLLHLASDAQVKKAWALRARTGSPLEIRIGQVWHRHAQAILSLQDSRDLCLSILNDQGRDQLDRTGFCEGWLQSNPVPIGYQVSFYEQGLSATLRWHNESDRNLSEWNLPAVLFEKWQRQPGLSLIYGPNLSSRSSLLRLIARRFRGHQVAAPVEKLDAVIFVDEQEFAPTDDLPIFESSVLVECKSRFGLDTLIFVDSRNPEVIRRAVQMAIAGATVILGVTANSVSSAFLELQAAVSPNSEAPFWPRLADCFVSAVGLRLISGLETPMQPVFELLVDTPETKECLRRGSVFGLVEIMSKGGDKSGMRTLNQALLQLLIKRKIELRVGFDQSPHPQELDRLLEKVGV